MEIKILVLALSMLFNDSIYNNLYSQCGHVGETKENYQLLIKKVILKVSENKDLSEIELQKIIPRTEAEFIDYISYGYKDSLKIYRKAFDEVDSMIAEKAKSNINNFFKLFLELAPLVDGMYSEIYFDRVDVVIEKNRILFCKIYNSLTQESKKKLEDYYKQYCK